MFGKSINPLAIRGFLPCFKPKKSINLCSRYNSNEIRLHRAELCCVVAHLFLCDEPHILLLLVIAALPVRTLLLCSQ